MGGKRIGTTRLLAAAAVAVLIGAACGKGGTTTGGASPTPSSGATTSGAPLKVALIAPSATNDLAFTQSMVDALNRVKAQYNLQVSITDNAFVVNDAANAIRTYASQGYNLVIAHGSQYGASVQQIAPQYPKVSFAWGTAGDTFGLPNVFAYQAAADEGGYVNGVMGALLSKSHVLGEVGPIKVGDAQLYLDGFKAGALAADPTAQVKQNYTGSFSDVSLATQAANSLIGARADVLTGSAQMVVGAVGVAKTRNIPWFGTQSNQTSLAPSVVVASQVYHWEVVLKQMLDGIRAGTLGGQTYTIDLKNGGEVIEFNPSFNLPAAVKGKADAAIQGITSGAVQTGVTAAG